MFDMECMLLLKEGGREAVVAFTLTNVPTSSWPASSSQAKKQTPECLFFSGQLVVDSQSACRGKGCPLSLSPRPPLVLSLYLFLSFTFSPWTLNGRSTNVSYSNKTKNNQPNREAMEEALQAAAEASGGDLTLEQVTKLHEEQSAKMKEDAGDYLYNLAGILVHAGVAQGGHYYSYIRDRGKSAYEDGAGLGARARVADDKTRGDGDGGRKRAAPEGGATSNGSGGGGKGVEGGLGGAGVRGSESAAGVQVIDGKPRGIGRKGGGGPSLGKEGWMGTDLCTVEVHQVVWSVSRRAMSVVAVVHIRGGVREAQRRARKDGYRFARTPLPPPRARACFPAGSCKENTLDDARNCKTQPSHMCTYIHPDVWIEGLSYISVRYSKQEGRRLRLQIAELLERRNVPFLFSDVTRLSQLLACSIQRV